MLVGCLGLVAASLSAIAPGAGAAPRAAKVATPCPASGTAAYVRYVYLTILERCPAPARTAYWVDRLNHGLPRADFTDMIDMSPENLFDNNVIPIFNGILKRSPKFAEAVAAEDLIMRTHGDAQVIAGLLASNEYYATVPGADPAAKDAAWLAAAFNQILDRTPPDTGPTTYWGSKLGTPSTRASRYRVAMGLEHSAENAASWVGGIYFVALRRNPSPSRFAFWMGWLQGPVGHWRTFRLFTLFLATQEAYNLAQTNPGPISDMQTLLPRR